MAKIPLKEITFPGLDNTYTIPEIDDTLSTAGKAADAKKTGDEISELKEDLNELNSNFADMQSDGVVPSAEQILTDKGVTDSVPYHFRKTGGNGADREYVDAIVGCTVAWNQLIEHGNFDNADSWSLINSSSKTASDNVLTGTMSSTGSFNVTLYKSCASLVDHKFLVGIDAKCTVSNALRIRYPNVSGSLALVSNTWARLETMITISANGTQVGAQVNGVSDETISFRNFVMFDLTAMFGSTIADYIYQLEQTTSGAGVAFFKALFPNDYYEYNAGELKSVEGVSAHVMRDADSNIIGNYPLDSALTLKGIPKLLDGKLYYDGDRYLPDGKVERRYGVVDLGTLGWTRQITQDGAQYPYRWLTPIAAIECSGEMTTVNGFSNTYKAMSYTDLMRGNIDCVVSCEKRGYINVVDSSKDNLTSAEFKAAMSGVKLVYELATPTIEEATPYRQLQICDPYGTEEFISTGIVPVGHDTRYPENLRAKIEGLPWDFSSLIAPTEKTTTASRNYTTGSLLIMNNTLYKATANIANGGTITPNTNCTATTLAEIISALA